MPPIAAQATKPALLESLKTRVTLLLLLAVGLIAVMFAAISWQRDSVLTERYFETLQQVQRLAWSRLEASALVTARAVQTDSASRLALSQALSNQDRGAVDMILRDLTASRPGARAEVHTADGKLFATTSSDLRPEPLMDPLALANLIGSVPGSAEAAERSAGLIQTKQGYFWIAATRVEMRDKSVGWLVIGENVEAKLPLLKAGLSAEVALLNLRGRAVASTTPALLANNPLLGLARDAQVVSIKADGAQTWRAVVSPFFGVDGRVIGALVTLRNESEQLAADTKKAFLLAVAALVGIGLMAAGVWWQVQRFMRPLERSVRVLGELARENLAVSLDDADEAQANEAGAIARGVAALRGEMLSLQVLREERLRVERDQARLIREQLTRLAAGLDEAARAEILATLDDEPSELVDTRHARLGDSSREPRSGLVGLARVLARLTDMINEQQARLLKLLSDLRQAMRQQALLLSLQQELEIARKMQLSILPRQPPATTAIEIASLMIPAKEIGGDFYDYFLLDEDHLAVVVADVSGKGVPAAFFMAISRTLLKANAFYQRDPALMMSQLNDQLCAENEQMMFVTVFYGLLELKTGTLHYVNAGHNPPLWVKSGDTDGTAPLFLPRGQNMAMAVMDGLTYTAGSLRLSVGDSLVLYTDGVTEAVNAAGKFFEEPPLQAAVAAAHATQTPLEQWPNAVLQAVRDFECGAAQADDITCVVLRYKGLT